tara:strand:- start:17440 stop:18372 length:933 start_codon:yes stop_codon:yes gene_type:complete
VTGILRIATRKSPLALWQAEFVKSELQRHHPGLQIELVAITTRGDKLLDTPLAKVGGKGLFVKELEIAMLEDIADIAVHSMKDVPMEFPQGLGLEVICEREDPSDAFVSNGFDSLAQMPSNSIIGTSSLRRQCQVRSAFPHLQVRELRGNVNTRLAKLDAGEYDAIILASAGLIRLNMGHRITQKIASSISLPAGGQGAVGIECRSDDSRTQRLLAPLNHIDSAICVLAERATNRHLQGGCQVPIACFAELDHDLTTLSLRGLVGSVSGSHILRAQAQGHRDNPEELGIQVAEDLLSQGAGKILAEVYES